MLALTALTTYCNCFESLQFLGCNRFRRLNALRESVPEREVQGIRSGNGINARESSHHDTGVSNKLCDVWWLICIFTSCLWHYAKAWARSKYRKLMEIVNTLILTFTLSEGTPRASIACIGAASVFTFQSSSPFQILYLKHEPFGRCMHKDVGLCT